MNSYIYQNNLISKKQLRQILGWTFTNYDCMQASTLADDIKDIGFKYASQAGISISIEDLKVPFVKNLMLEKANEEILNSQKIYLKGKLTDVERFEKIIDTWGLTSESLKDQVVYYFKNYDPLNSVYIMAFSGARGNLSQVRQLVGMRGLMSDPSGQIMNLPIKKNFREGLTITDYLMSGYGARKGIVDTALKTANSGYLTRRLIDVAQDILIREKDCLTTHSFLVKTNSGKNFNKDQIYDKVIGRILNKPIFDKNLKKIIAKLNTQITPSLIKTLKEKNITEFYIRSPLTCNLYRAICQKCYGWDLANENLVDFGEAIGILAGQSIGEPGTQLTMRTFHTGGIFTSKVREQLISPRTGVIQFSKFLKTVSLRTNRGENVLVSKNAGSILLISQDFSTPPLEILIASNTILFPKNNQYIKKNSVLAELIKNNKQVKKEVKPILSYNSGEIFIPYLKNNINLSNNNKLLWLLSGELYNSPISSFINFYPDYKLSKSSFIFRTKLLNHYQGFVKLLNKTKNLYEKRILIKNNKYSLINTQLKNLVGKNKRHNHILIYKNLKYLINTRYEKSEIYIRKTVQGEFGKLLKNSFLTLTGGTLFYDQSIHKNSDDFKTTIFSFPELTHFNPFYRTLIWLSEETQKVNCDPNILLIKNGDFISSNFEIVPGKFSKTSGSVILNYKNNIVQTVTIKCGKVYQSKEAIDEGIKFYYPGEKILSNIIITAPSLCEISSEKNGSQVLIRSIDLYEFPKVKTMEHIFQKDNVLQKILNLKVELNLSYKSNQIVKTKNNLNLISESLNFIKYYSKNKLTQLINNISKNEVNFQIIENLYLNEYIHPKLKYKNLQSCLQIQKNQFVDRYTILVFLEALTSTSLEIVKFKINRAETKQILLISNNNCVTVKKNTVGNKKLNDFVINPENMTDIGKIIIENKNFVTIQKGRPYFFPKCKVEILSNNRRLEYKFLRFNDSKSKIKTNRSIHLNSYDSLKISIQQPRPSKFDRIAKIKFGKFFLKKNGKLYSCLIPRFVKKFTVKNTNSTKILPNIINLKKEINKKILNKSKTLLTKIEDKKSKDKKKKRTVSNIGRTLLMQSQDMVLNDFKNQNSIHWTLIKFIKYPFTKSSRSVGLCSIIEDFSEQEVNSLFCKNKQFIEDGETIGLLNLEKEITGDIVQGLPRIEEILEGRKKKQTISRIARNQKKGLLIQKTSLDPNFDFRKLGTPIKENDKINPHKLLKTYFIYYGLVKSFYLDREKWYLEADEQLSLPPIRLINNSEASYKSFKKVQSFILNSVQSVYQSQGVTINDKHLEVIIKQMTTKVLITYEGNSPLLRREVIDLYHIEYINEILKNQNKIVAYYVPLLFGITKAALNNPSFISAASFQETTRVLTKAAIEGRIDWLRGLKENIIIGHLIPAGTGCQSYRKSFKKLIVQKQKESLAKEYSII